MRYAILTLLILSGFVRAENLAPAPRFAPRPKFVNPKVEETSLPKAKTRIMDGVIWTWNDVEKYWFTTVQVQNQQPVYQSQPAPQIQNQYVQPQSYRPAIPAFNGGGGRSSGGGC